MATVDAEDVEMWTVFIEAQDKSLVRRLPGNTTVDEVRQLWEDMHQPQAGSLIKTPAGVPIVSLQELWQVGERKSGRRTVNLIIEEAAIVFVRIYTGKDEGEVCQIAAALSSRPEELHPEVRARFRLPDERIFRLLDSQGPLKYNVSLEEQGVVANVLLEVDLGYEMQVTKEWEKLVDSTLMYSSEYAAEMLPDDYADDERFLIANRRLDFTKTLGDALPSQVSNLTELFVSRQSPRSITVMVDRFMRQQVIWPTDKLNIKLSQPPSTKCNFMYEGQHVLPSDSFRKINVVPVDNALIHSTVAVSVQYSNGKCEVLRVPQMGCVADLEEEVSKRERSREFTLRCGGRVLQSDDSIDASMTGKGVVVERDRWRMTVTLRDRSVRWKIGKAVRYSQLLYQLARRSGIEWRELLDIHLRCDGCGRRLTRQQERFQQIPAGCCQMQSLQLSDRTPPKRLNVGTQAESWLPWENSRRGTLGVEVQTETLQSDVSCHHPSVGVQTKGLKTSTSCQHPSWRKLTFRLQIWCHGFKPEEDILLSVPLTLTPTVREVRVAIAWKLGRMAQNTVLRRWVGKIDEEPVFAVGGGWDMANAAGTILGKWPDTEEQDCTTLERDQDQFLVVPGHENRLIVGPEDGLTL